jgi:DNA-binding transcriptional MerR regulator
MIPFFPHYLDNGFIQNCLCYLYLIIMSKSLAQITFDFTSVDEPTPIPVVPAVPEEAVIQEEPVPVTEVAVLPAKIKRGRVSAGKRGRKSLKDISLDADLVQVPEDEVLFKKQYYSIGDVALMFRENQSLIRYWETEFDLLQPRKNRKGDRFFRPVDIKNLVLIYDLLRRRKFTIEGAKDFLKRNNAQTQAGKGEDKFALIQSLQKIKGFLLEIKANL